MAAAADDEGWDIDLGAMATIWRGGCIIRARFLDRIREAYDAEPGLANLMLADFFADGAGRGPGPVAPGGRRGGRAGHPDARLLLVAGLLRRLPPRRAGRPALIQGLRDLFGAHTYQRVDREGTFHMLWGAGRPRGQAGLTAVTFRRSRSSTGYTHMRSPGGPTWLTPPPYRCTPNHRRPAVDDARQARARAAVRGRVHRLRRRVDRQHRAAVDPPQPALLRAGPAVGPERLPAHLRRLHAARRPGRRPDRPPAGAGHRHGRDRRSHR